MNILIRKFLAVALVAVASAFPFAGANAGIVATEELAVQGTADAQRERVRQFMAREDVVESLVDLGVPAELAKKRAEALTDAEVVTIAGKIDQLPAGGALRQTETILLLLLIIVLLIAL